MRGLGSAVAAAVLLGGGVGVSSAWAAGGASIAAAPIVAYGQQEFGNTTTDGGVAFLPGEGGSGWWKLPVVAGDEVTVDFSGQSQGDGFTLGIYPSDANDYNYNQVDRIGTSAQENTFAYSFVAPATGLDPMNVYTPDSVGDYNFIASVRHQLVARLIVGRTNRASNRTRFMLSLHNPDGAVVSANGLSMRVQSRSAENRWRTIDESPAQGSFTIRWPKRLVGTRLQLRVLVTGSAYRAAQTAVVRLRVR